MIKKILSITLFFMTINNFFSQKIIEMNYENGIYTIPCKVNNIPMKFIFDTGASDVSISLTEAKFLIKQGLLTDNDIKGKVKYRIANGEIENGTKIILKEINIDGFILKNVEASIVHQLNAPLLLGQSAISKLGTFQIDGNKLIINSGKLEKFDFLGINLKEDVNDLGFSTEYLNKDKKFTIANFESLKISKNHFLKEYNFDVQQIIFNSKGIIVAIRLEKNTPDDILNKKEYSINNYNLIVKELKKEFSEEVKQKENETLWESKSLQLSLKRDSNKKTTLTYIVPVALIKKNINSYKTGEEEIIESRKNLMKTLNETFNNIEDKIIKRMFARINENNLEIHSELIVSKIFEKKQVNSMIQTLSYNLLRMLTINNGKELLVESNFNYLIFKIQIKDINNNRKYGSKKISKINIQDLKIPFSEKEVIDILENNQK